MRKRVMLGLLAVVTVASTTFGATGSANAAGAQFTLFDATAQQTGARYWQPGFSSPANWLTPNNYADGTVYWHLKVTSKPSSLPTLMQVCFWRSSFTIEMCSKYAPTVTDEGECWINLGAPRSWWKKNNNWNFNNKPDVVRLMMKDKASGRLLMGSSCGSFCYPRSDLAKHVPITATSEVVVVARGATLTPLSKWVGSCPTAWSSACSGSGGGGGTGLPTVSISDGQVLEPDTGYKSLPFKLTLSKASSSNVSVRVNIKGGTATAGVDFDTRGGSVLMTIPAGQTTAWVGFGAYGDNVKEANETVFVTLSNPVNATIGDGSGTGTIINDD